MFSKAYVVILFTWGRVYLVPGSCQVLGPMLLRGGGVRVSVVPGPIFRGVGVGYRGGLGYTYSPSPRRLVRILLECFLVASGSSFFFRIYLCNWDTSYYGQTSLT